MRIPHGDRAELGTKLEDYTLNATHREGRHKARMFELALGITQANRDLLGDALTRATAAMDNAVAKGDNGHGDVYVLDFSLSTDAGAAMVRSVWIIRHGEDFPRLITCYIL